MKAYLMNNGAVDVIDIDQLPESKYTLPRDYSMEKSRPKTKPDEECCSNDPKVRKMGLNLRQPL